METPSAGPGRNLEEIYTQDKGRLLGYTAGKFRGRDGHDEEDVLQDAVLGVLEQVLNPIENLAGYLYRAIGNRITDLFRKKSRQDLSLDELTDALDGHALDRILEDRAGSVERALTRKETVAEVQAALARLSPAERAVVVATEMEGRSFSELAEEWDEPLGTLLSRKHRAVQKLRNWLKTHKGEE